MQMCILMIVSSITTLFKHKPTINCVYFPENRKESDAVAADDKHKGGRLISRTFVEHLNCFLPNIEKNRIFPLCNSRCADKIRICSHIEDNQPKKRQPYIPPNSRASGV